MCTQVKTHLSWHPCADLPFGWSVIGVFLLKIHSWGKGESRKCGKWQFNAFLAINRNLITFYFTKESSLCHINIAAAQSWSIWLNGGKIVKMPNFVEFSPFSPCSESGLDSKTALTGHKLLRFRRYFHNSTIARTYVWEPPVINQEGKKRAVLCLNPPCPNVLNRQTAQRGMWGKWERGKVK